MATCGSCVSKVDKNNIPGCRNNGSCLTDGCDKLSTFNWLADMESPGLQDFDVVEVRFKSGRKEFFRNINHLALYPGDPVVLDVPNGHHIGYISLQGELVRLQMLKKKVDNDENIRGIYRVATQRDIEKFEEVKKREMPTMYRTREIILESWA
jgi:hypothetical protein